MKRYASPKKLQKSFEKTLKCKKAYKLQKSFEKTLKCKKAYKF